jgi:NADPH:quinone reductase-like Zn-dependent oxidoreductase
MRAWQLHELGDPNEVLKLEEVEDPQPGPDEVVVEVEAAALNFFDILLCKGEYQEHPELPFTPGAEVSGTVIAAGDNAHLTTGTRVLAMPPLPKGGFAEKAAVPVPAGESRARRDCPRSRGGRRRGLGGDTGRKGSWGACDLHGRRPGEG